MRNQQNKGREEIECRIIQVNSELAGLSAEKEDKARQLARLRAESQQIEERLSERTAGAVSYAREGACVSPGVNESNLSTGEREDFNAAREAVNTAVAVYNKLGKLIADKEHVLADLLQERAVIVCSSAADETISFQAETKRAREEVITLRGAIARQEESISAEEEKAPRESDLTAKRAEILAEISIGGKATLDDLESIDRQIQERGELSAARSQVNQTIAGLRVKLMKAESELKGLEARWPTVVNEFLTAEAEKIGEEYLQAANSLEACFRRLIALDRIMKRKEFAGIASGRVAEILIPAFNLKSQADKRGKLNFNKYELQITNTASGRHNHELEGDISTEINKWNVSGIEL